MKIRRDGRVVEGARLESVYTVKGIKGSNPFLSANIFYLVIILQFKIIFISIVKENWPFLYSGVFIKPVRKISFS